MKIESRQDIATRKRFIIIEIEEDYLINKCQPHPAAELITAEQGLGIITDAVLLAMGLELKHGEEMLGAGLGQTPPLRLSTENP